MVVSGFWISAIARAYLSPSLAKIRPGVTSSDIPRNLTKSWLKSEYAGETGTTGTPTYIAAKVTKATSTLFSDNTTIGRSADSSHCRINCPIDLTRCRDSAYETLTHLPPAFSEIKTRSGASQAQRLK